jgi:hypothetical protein
MDRRHEAALKRNARAAAANCHLRAARRSRMRHSTGAPRLQNPMLKADFSPLAAAIRESGATLRWR